MLDGVLSPERADLLLRDPVRDQPLDTVLHRRRQFTILREFARPAWPLMDHQVVSAGMVMHQLAVGSLLKALGGCLACFNLRHFKSPSVRRHLRTDATRIMAIHYNTKAHKTSMLLCGPVKVRISARYRISQTTPRTYRYKARREKARPRTRPGSPDFEAIG